MPARLHRTSFFARRVLKGVFELTVGGPHWTVYRPSGNVNTLLGVRRLAIVRFDLGQYDLVEPIATAWRASWLCYAPLGTDVRENDIAVDTSRNLAFQLTTEVDTTLGLMIAPVIDTPRPDL